jgi:hypothetical protein
MSAPLYPKIETLFERSKEGDTLGRVTTTYRSPDHQQVKDWLVTEKIDGQNIRVSLEQDETGLWVVKFYGRSDNAQLPPKLLTYLQETFTLNKMTRLCLPNKEGDFVIYPICLYGEGYGEGIQKGGYYRKGVSFRLFDVLAENRWWLSWEDVCEVSGVLDIDVVTSFGLWSTDTVVDIVFAGIVKSHVANEDRPDRPTDVPMEGVVARTDPYLYDKFGGRVMFKLKARDFTPGKWS